MKQILAICAVLAVRAAAATGSRRLLAPLEYSATGCLGGTDSTNYIGSFSDYCQGTPSCCNNTATVTNFFPYYTTCISSYPAGTCASSTFSSLACCPRQAFPSSSAAPAPAPVPAPGPALAPGSSVPATQCSSFSVTADDSGSFGTRGCGRQSPFCCNGSPRDNATFPAGFACIPDTSGVTYGGGCTSPVYSTAACCAA